MWSYNYLLKTQVLPGSHFIFLQDLINCFTEVLVLILSGLGAALEYPHLKKPKHKCTWPFLHYKSHQPKTMFKSEMHVCTIVSFL